MFDYSNLKQPKTLHEGLVLYAKDSNKFFLIKKQVDENTWIIDSYIDKNLIIPCGKNDKYIDYNDWFIRFKREFYIVRPGNKILSKFLSLMAE